LKKEPLVNLITSAWLIGITVIYIVMVLVPKIQGRVFPWNS